MSQVSENLRFKWVWLFIGYALIAFVLQQTLTSSPASIGIHLSDKFMHTVGYFVLMGWFVQIYRRSTGRTIWAFFFVCMGITLEFLQGLTGVRHFEVYDMFANSLGVLIAWLLSFTRFSGMLLWFEKHLPSKIN